MKLQFQNPETLQTVQRRIVTAACLGLAALAVIGGWTLTGALEDWETVAGGLVFMALLAGLVALARRKHPALAAGLLSGLLFGLVSLG